MSVEGLSTSTQNYLKVVWTLGEWSGEPVTASLVAERMSLRLSTVSDAIRKLTEQGLLDHTPYGAVALTDTGRSYAVAMVRRHRLLETFLVTTLGYTWDQVHDEAEHLEHAVSDFLVDRIDHLLGHPSRDPHGDPIPGPDGAVEDLGAACLADLDMATEQGRPFRVERIADDDPGLLQFLGASGIAVSTRVRVTPGPPYSGSVHLVPDGSSVAPVVLGPAATAAVWVSRDPA